MTWMGNRCRDASMMHFLSRRLSRPTEWSLATEQTQCCTRVCGDETHAQNRSCMRRTGDAEDVLGVLRCSSPAGRWAAWSPPHERRRCASSLQWRCPRRWRRSPRLPTPASAGRIGGTPGTGTGRRSPCCGGPAGSGAAASLQDGQTRKELKSWKKTFSAD